MKGILIAWLLLWAGVASGQKPALKNGKGGPSPIAEQASVLERLFEKVKAATGPEKARAERQFFEAFPASYQEFNRVYGAIDSADRPVFGPLYERPEHVALFNSLATIPRREYCAKQIGIALGGQWDADNVSAFQHRLQEKVLREPAVFVSLLKAKPEQDVRSFWWFLLDTPHPMDPQARQLYQKLYLRVKPLSPALAFWMKEEHARLLEESDGHGA